MIDGHGLCRHGRDHFVGIRLHGFEIVRASMSVDFFVDFEIESVFSEIWIVPSETLVRKVVDLVTG